MFRYVDLFSGIGGFRIALDSTGGNCVFSSEMNPSCREVYRANFGEEPSGDITLVNEDHIPDHDVLAGGFPCQAFSIAGKKAGFEDTRGTLFFDVARIARAKNPRVLFLENVKNLVHHDRGRTLEVIKSSLEALGYNFSWEILNTRDFGLAQNRERTIIVASKNKRFDFDPVKRRKFEMKSISDIMEPTGEFEVLPPSEYTILDPGLMKKQRSGLIFAGYRNKPIRKTGVRPNTEHLSRAHKQPNRIYHTEGSHPTLASQETSGRFWIYDGKVVRKMTIRECYSLQGFPKDFKISPNLGNAYRQIGNSVGIPVIRAVAEEIIKQIL